MSHLNEATLGQILSRAVTPRDAARIQYHIERCRACARRLEEWRDNFDQVDEVLPEVPHMEAATTTQTPGGVVVVPAEAEERVSTADLTRGLWIAVGVMIIVVAYAFGRGRHSSPPPTGLAYAREFTTTRSDLPASDPGQVPAGTSGRTGRPAGSADPPNTRPSDSETRLPVSPGFSLVGPAEALRRLGGPIRTLSGLSPDHLEAAPAKAVPGALKGLDVVRVVYRGSNGARIMVDQQRIPPDSNGLHPVDDPSLENGDTKFTQGPAGSSVATWVDDQGYRISVAAKIPQDSLRQLVKQVQ